MSGARARRHRSRRAGMGIGQVVTLRVPPERLREVNRVIEKGWGADRTDSYPTYDYLPIWRQAHPQR